jgi:hypothetical protein
MIKKLLAVLPLAFGISAIAPNEKHQWNTLCNHLGKSISEQTAHLDQVEAFFKKELANPAKLITLACSLQPGILAAAGISESRLASLYFLKKTAETKLPGTQKLQLDGINQRYNDLHNQLYPKVAENRSSSNQVIKNVFRGIALAAFCYLAYRIVPREKKHVS